MMDLGVRRGVVVGDTTVQESSRSCIHMIGEETTDRFPHRSTFLAKGVAVETRERSMPLLVKQCRVVCKELVAGSHSE